MNTAMQQWRKATETWIEETKLVMKGNESEKEMLLQQNELNQKRIQLLEQQNEYWNKAIVDREIAIEEQFRSESN